MTKMSTVMTIEEKDLDSVEKRKNFTIGIVGSGRIYLLYACLFAQAGFKVVAADLNQYILTFLKKDRIPYLQTECNTLLKRYIKDGLLIPASNIREVASKSDAIVLLVHVIIDQNKKPNYSSVEKACREVGMNLRSGCLVIVASMMGLGITESLVKVTLENASGLRAGVDFGLAYSPPNISSKSLEDLANFPRVVGGVNKRSLQVACFILKTIINGEVVMMENIRDAEAVKLFEDAYQDANIALANEFAKFCEKIGIDFMTAQKAISLHSNCPMPIPRIAKGNSLKASHILLEEARLADARLLMLSLALKVNDDMLRHGFRLVMDSLRACNKTIRRSRVSVLGISGHPDVKDLIGFPAERFVNMMKKRGMVVRVYDPLFSYNELVEMGYPAERTLRKAVEGADCLIVVSEHDQFRHLNLNKIKFLVRKPSAIVDIARAIDPIKAEREGFIYRGLGRGA
jgi:nucleotide sugar dehydrogenase